MSAFQPEIGVDGSWPVDATQRMNRMYRWQRHIYDATRRYYLLGRDHMIDGLKPAPRARVLEIGCGTGRNLIVASRRYPEAKFFGLDVSTEMLTSAIAAIARDGRSDRVRVAHGDATAFDPRRMFGVRAFDHVMISYCLSMIADWPHVLEAAAHHLAPGGSLHIVDFGDQHGLPRWARTLLRRWLALFDVTPRDDLARTLQRFADSRGATLRFERPYRGYAQYAVISLPPGPRAP
ncbi:S-adenosylmethionine-diacylgycerolhomoserine-N-methyltransferase [Rhodopseudomonas rhenobacensis]|uniref:S-adenosylmethionine-diacylgycerolhomoserine-N-methyltransferase n=1 Tax=Rhodopseudomonas rhenobacensis TaxID=87461 RepID=A0A7W7Z678_9BRAD|nr:class I SAM-dependent methyltransferase [Rhodopseudomonas rhenobacensis]MBB5048744.1 S-adenosylmethionine-diacylgycerolhomoserine-N-methyltransferase [Rhodopseudomonas rhenobacensis]